MHEKKNEGFFYLLVVHIGIQFCTHSVEHATYISVLSGNNPAASFRGTCMICSLPDVL